MTFNLKLIKVPFKIMFEFKLLVYVLLVLVHINCLSSKPFKIMGSFRLPRHYEKNTILNKDKLIDKTQKTSTKSATIKKPTIFPIIYPIVLTPNTIKQLTLPVMSNPSSDQVLDANIPIANLVKLIVNDNHTLNDLNQIRNQVNLSNQVNNLNQMGHSNQINPLNQLSTINHMMILPNQAIPFNQMNDLNSINPMNPIDPINPMHSINPMNPMNPMHSINPMNQMNPMNSINPMNPMNSINPMHSINSANPVNPTNIQTQLNNQMNQINQLIQLSEKLNKTNGKVLKPMINDRLLMFNQSQNDLKPDYDYGFDYDAFLNKLELNKELNFLDQFFRDDLNENPNKGFAENEPLNKMNKMDTENSFKTEFQKFTNETHYPIFYHDNTNLNPNSNQNLNPNLNLNQFSNQNQHNVDSYQYNQQFPVKVYSTYLFPVYTPVKP